MSTRTFNSSAGATSNAKGLVKFTNKNGTGNSLENFLEGISGKGSSIFVGDPVRDVHTNHLAVFFQDDYRMTPKITVNIGVRYELATVIQDTNSELGNFDPNSPTGLVQVGEGITAPYNPDHRDWSPRAGFAWDLQGNHKTVIRAGASMLYEFCSRSRVHEFRMAPGHGLGKVPTGAELCVNGSCVAGSGTIAATTFNPLPSGVTNGWQNNAATSIFQASTVACGDGKYGHFRARVASWHFTSALLYCKLCT